MTRDEDDKFKCHYSRSSCCATYEEELFNENKPINYNQSNNEKDIVFIFVRSIL